MKFRTLAVILAAVGLVAGVALTPSIAADQVKKAEKAAAGQAGQEMPAEWQEWAKYANPGEHHGHIAPMVGTWHARTTVWMEPGAEPSVSEGTQKNEWVLGKRFILETFDSEMMGEPFTGMGLFGYDNYKQQHVSTWADTMGTMIMMSHGDCLEGGKKMTLNGSYEDPMTKKLKTMRMVLTIEDNDRHVFEAYGDDPEGKEFKMMETVYTRK